MDLLGVGRRWDSLFLESWLWTRPENRDLGFFSNSPNGYAHQNRTAILCKVIESYCTVVETHRAGTKQVFNWHSTLAFNIGIQHWHSTLTFNIDIQH